LIRVLREGFRGAGPNNGVELGVWCGETSEVLCTSFPSLHLLMVDAWDLELMNTMKRKDKDVQAIATAEEQARDVADRFGTIVMKMSSRDAAAIVLDQTVDFVFIDACHLYESTKQDINLWYPKVREGGVLCGHDYNGVMDKRGKWGVKQAVDEFCDKHHIPLKTAGRIWWFVKGDFDNG